MGWSQGAGSSVLLFVRSTRVGTWESRVGELKVSGKPFEISKWAVWEAYQKVKANKGAPESMGVDRGVREGSSRKSFTGSGTGCLGLVLPASGASGEIAKPHGGGTRMLGVPTVGRPDRADSGSRGAGAEG